MDSEKAPNAAPKQRKPPQRSQSADMHAARELVMRMTPAERDELHGLLVGVRSAPLGFVDDPSMRQRRRQLELVASIHDVNRSKLAKDNAPLRTVDDYNKHRLSGDPAYSTLKRWLGGWPAPLSAAGLLIESRAEPSLTTSTGQAKGQLRFTFDDLILCLACCIEELHGVLPTQRMYTNWRDGKPAHSTPSYNRIARGDGERKGWPTMCDLTVEHIRRNPTLYPQAYAIWGRIPQGSVVLADSDEAA